MSNLKSEATWDQYQSLVNQIPVILSSHDNQFSEKEHSQLTKWKEQCQINSISDLMHKYKRNIKIQVPVRHKCENKTGLGYTKPTLN